MLDEIWRAEQCIRAHNRRAVQWWLLMWCGGVSGAGGQKGWGAGGSSVRTCEAFIMMIIIMMVLKLIHAVIRALDVVILLWL